MSFLLGRDIGTELSLRAGCFLPWLKHTIYVFTREEVPLPPWLSSGVDEEGLGESEQQEAIGAGEEEGDVEGDEEGVSARGEGEAVS